MTTNVCVKFFIYLLVFDLICLNVCSAAIKSTISSRIRLSQIRQTDYAWIWNYCIWFSFEFFNYFSFAINSVCCCGCRRWCFYYYFRCWMSFSIGSHHLRLTNSSVSLNIRGNICIIDDRSTSISLANRRTRVNEKYETFVQCTRNMCVFSLIVKCRFFFSFCVPIIFFSFFIVKFSLKM